MIYFIRSEDGPVKIGFVQHRDGIDERLRKLQTGHPAELWVEALVQGGRDAEHTLHQRFSEGRLYGEWFRADTPGLHETLLRAIQVEALQLSGEPVAM